jgi:mono/diheme cytochrome c family protein
MSSLYAGNRILLLQSVLISFLILSCSGEKKPNPSALTTDHEKAIVQPEVRSQELQAGQDIYKRYCLSCHQSNGKGVSGMYPPLAGNTNLKGQRDSLINIVLRGKAGKVEVNGDVYVGIMASHNYLTDEQVANVLNYILNGMNKFATKISPSEVTVMRDKLK